MPSSILHRLAERQGWLDPAGEQLQSWVHQAFDALGGAGRPLQNLLHGVWLGHPLHPALTDVPIGAWTTALALDGAALVIDRGGLEDGADVAIGVGLLGAVGAAVTGATDWSATSGDRRRFGLAHGLLNVAATGFYAASLVLRRRGRRGAGLGLSLVGYAIAAGAAQLGGDLVYRHRLGVDNSDQPPGNPGYTRVLDSGELEEGTLRRVELDGVPVVLARVDGEVQGILATCSHLRGPLDEGTLEGGAVTCPWHGSRFCLADGSVIDGPATAPQPVVEVRERAGGIEIKA
jgi:nitrite reductase/ring-hydroxylating ferredoxin subunit/uncharacterized membrane protein